MRRLNLITQRLGRILTPNDDIPPSRPLPPPPANPGSPQKKSRLPFPLFFERLDNPFLSITNQDEASATPPTSLQDRQIQCGLPLEYTFPGYPLGKDLSTEPLPFQGDPNSYSLIDSLDSFGGF